MSRPCDGASTGCQPDPSDILEEARQHTAAGRYAEALAKHLWYHNHALDHSQTQCGVRLSFALGYWVHLGSLYPPALEELTKIRDECLEQVRAGSDVRSSFADYASINRALGMHQPTVDLFAWLDAHMPDQAANAFRSARPALLKAKEYRLCDRYLEPERELETLRSMLEGSIRVSQGAPDGKRYVRSCERMYRVETATLVALLVLNGRQIEAESTAATALVEHDNVSFRKLLDKAIQGKLPRE
jgi:hypothetical protein